MLRLFQALAVALIAASAPVTAAHAEEKSVFVYDFELEDTSLDGAMIGTTDAEFARLKSIAERLREHYDAHPAWQIVRDDATIQKGREANLQSCGHCDVKNGKALGVDVVVTGVVQKVSNLILSITIYARSTETGELVAVAGTDIRGNTDESWQRGLDWLARNRLDLIAKKKG